MSTEHSTFCMITAHTFDSLRLHNNFPRWICIYMYMLNHQFLASAYNISYPWLMASADVHVYISTLYTERLKSSAIVNARKPKLSTELYYYYFKDHAQPHDG